MQGEERVGELRVIDVAGVQGWEAGRASRVIAEVADLAERFINKCEQECDCAKRMVTVNRALMNRYWKPLF
jgi:hypothetical protein